MNVTLLKRTLDQELLALSRGASLECLACGEFVLQLADGSLFCPECGSGLRPAVAEAALHEASPLVPSG